MITDPNHFLWATLGLFAFILITAVLGTLAKWTHHHTSRHQLIVESKRRRAEYLKALAERGAGIEN